MAYKLDIEKVTEAIKASLSWRETAIKLNMKYPSNSVYRTLPNFCKKHGINYSHFLGRKSSAGKTFPVKDMEKYFNNKQKISSHHLKKLIIKSGVKKPQCERCNNTQWNELPIPLELHHIDGVSNNNNLENLQLLCPNCHSQTTNFCGKNIKTKANRITVSDQVIISTIPLCCSIKEVLDAVRLSSAKANYDRVRLIIKQENLTLKQRERSFEEIAYRLSSRKVTRPSKEELEKLIWEKPTTQIAKSYGVSDKAIQKWCEFYGIPKPPRGYWMKNKNGVVGGIPTHTP